jgi:ABC-type branched-subunit amino acid transport system substrate-binding protein
MPRQHRWREAVAALRPLTLGVAGLALVAGVLSAGGGAVGAATHHVSRFVPVTDYPAYVGGSGKANPKLSPVYIGAVNQQTAAGAIAPAWTTGVKVAVDYANQNTDGIDGHPIDVVYCAIPTTVGSAEKCGEEFANNSKIVAVIAGAIDVGNTALEHALEPSKKPIFWDVSLSPVDEEEPQGFIWWNTDTYVNAPDATFAKTIIHAKSVSLIYPETTPAEVTQADTVYAALKYEGIDTIYKVGYTGKSSNLTEPFEAAHVGHTSLVIAVDSGGPTCSDIALTLKSLGLETKVKLEVDVPCATPTNAKADGGQLPHDWYYLTAQAMPGAKTPSLTTVAKKIFAEYHKAPLYANAWSEMGISEILGLAKLGTALLKEGRHVTPATIFAAARAFKGPTIQGAPHLDCGGFKTPATCNDLDQFFQNTAPTVMKPVSTWIGPPKGFKPPAAS